MLKILLALLIAANVGVLFLLISGIFIAVKSGGGSVLFPGLGLVVSLPALLIVLFIFELGLAAMTIALFRYIKNQSLKLV